MSQLQKLIDELCPNGVEFKKLGEVTLMQRGTSVTKKNAVEGSIPVISGGREPAFYINQANREGETITVAGSGAGAGFVQFWNEPIFVNDAFSVKGTETLLTKYVFYCMKNMQEQISGTQKGGGVPHVHISSIEKFEIPVPPLPVQEEIVRILDKFTTLEAELEAELDCRKRQYEYYRDKLLTFSKLAPPLWRIRGDVKWLKMSEIATFTYGFTDKAKDTGDARFIRITDIDDFGNLIMDNPKYIKMTEDSRKYLLKKGDLLMARTGATYGKTLFVPTDESAIFASFLIKITFDNSIVLNRYYWHFSKSRLYWQQAEKLVSIGGQQQFNTNAIGRVVIPIPPIEEQRRIVSILDSFETLTTDLQSGLPAEIAARRRQYEYYREKLLTFKRKAA